MEVSYDPSEWTDMPPASLDEEGDPIVRIQYPDECEATRCGMPTACRYARDFACETSLPGSRRRPSQTG